MKEETNDLKIERSQFGIRIDHKLQKVVRAISDKYGIPAWELVESAIDKLIREGEVKFRPEIIKDIEIFCRGFEVDNNLPLSLENPVFKPLSSPVHIHPDRKGVLFDTNLSYSEKSIWEMMENKRVAAYGSIMYVVEYLHKGDIVFFYHKGFGIVAAGKVISDDVKSSSDIDQYKDVEFLTPVPTQKEGITKYLPAAEIRRILEQNFFWSRTLKVPYLTPEQCQILLDELKNIL